MPIVFTYKCGKGHVMDVEHPGGTQLDDEDETTCAKCLDAGEVKAAYVVAVKTLEAGPKDGRR